MRIGKKRAYQMLTNFLKIQFGCSVDFKMLFDSLLTDY